MLEKLDFAGY